MAIKLKYYDIILYALKCNAMFDAITQIVTNDINSVISIFKSVGVFFFYFLLESEHSKQSGYKKKHMVTYYGSELCFNFITKSDIH